MKHIPLATSEKYYACDQGFIYRGKKKLNGWKAKHRTCNKYYMRYAIKMKNGDYKLFYGQRLVAFAYHDLKEGDGRLVRHLTPDSLNNAPEAIAVGDHFDNNVVDRIMAGTYMQRGRAKP